MVFMFIVDRGQLLLCWRICLKRLVLLIVPIFISIGISGCTTKQEEGTGVISIVFGTIETMPAQRESLTGILESFHKKYPDIKVKIQYGDFQKLHIQMAGDTAPDVFYYLGAILPPIAKSGQVLCVESLFSEEERKDLEDFFPSSLDSCRYKGELYAMPIQVSIGTLFYNKDIFDKEGISYPDENWTWDEFLEAASKLTKDFDGDGRIDQYGTTRPNWGVLMQSYGVKFFNYDVTEILFNTPEFRDCLQYLADLNLKHKVIPTESEIKEMGGVGNTTLFSMGRVAICEGSIWMLSEFAKIKDFKWDIALMPRGKKRVASISTGILCISSQTKHPKEAWQFVKFYTSKEGLTLQAKLRNSIPPRISVANSPVFATPPPEHIQIAIEAAEEYPYIVSAWGTSPDKLKELEKWDTIRNIEFELTYLGKQSIEESVQNLVSKTKQFLRAK